MAVIRPFNPPVFTPTQARGAAEARQAQRAFFQQALGDPTPVRAAPVAHAQAPEPMRAIIRPIPDEPPARVMRPGSFVDVKI